MRLAVASLLCLVWMAALGCASWSLDLSNKKGSLEEAQRKYTELVRWGEIDGASVYVDPTLAGAYLDNAQLFENIRFTDFESGPLEFSEDAETATVNVVYHAYSTRTLVEKRFRERQDWYLEEGKKNSWRVRPNLEVLAQQFGDSQ